MRQNNRTKAQQRYKIFDKRSKNICAFLFMTGLLILVSFIICMQYVDDHAAPVLISIGALVLWFIALCTIASKLNSKRIKLYEDAYGTDCNIIRTGLFGEIWDEFEWNQFEGLTNGKVVFAEAYNNTIELEIIRNKHVFNITIDNDAVYMVMDDETDTPVETEVSLSEMTDVGHIFKVIREFVESV